MKKPPHSHFHYHQPSPRSFQLTTTQSLSLHSLSLFILSLFILSLFILSLSFHFHYHSQPHSTRSTSNVLFVSDPPDPFAARFLSMDVSVTCDLQGPSLACIIIVSLLLSLLFSTRSTHPTATGTPPSPSCSSLPTSRQHQLQLQHQKLPVRSEPQWEHQSG